MPRLSRLAALFSITAGVLIAPFAQAQLTTFAQFLQPSNAFQYQSTGQVGSGNATLTTTNASLLFFYSNIASLPADLVGTQTAHITFTSFSTLGPSGTGTQQDPFTQLFDGSGVNQAVITITRDTPAAEGNGSRTILLQAIFTPFTFSGQSGGSGSFSASSLAGTVTFTSDFLDFGAAIERDVGVAFSSITPGLLIGANGFFNAFTAAGTGTFSSNPVPIFIPEPSTYMLMSIALVCAAGVAARRRRLLCSTGR